MRKGIMVNVTTADRACLRAVVANRNSPQEHVWRANIILLTADGLGTNAIMRGTGRAKSVVWRQAMTFAFVDRLVHHATIFEMNVESYRRRTAVNKHRHVTPPGHHINPLTERAKEVDRRGPVRRRSGPHLRGRSVSILKQLGRITGRVTCRCLFTVLRKHVDRATLQKVIEDLQDVPGSKSFRDAIERLSHELMKGAGQG